MRRYIPILLLAGILIFGATMRFIGLGQNPPGIIDDEADAAYDAYSLILTGKDQWGKAWPLTSFRGFGDYRLPGYTYLSIPSIAVFGLTPFAIRFPSALMGTLTILLVYLFVRELFKERSETMALLSAFFLSVSPWHLGMSRIGLEETTSVFFVTCGMLMLLRGRTHAKQIVVGMTLLGFSLYVYTSNIVLVPLLLLFTIYVFRKIYVRFPGTIVIGAVIFLILFAGFFISSSTSTAATRARQVNLTNNAGLIDTVNEKQGACTRMFPKMFCRIVINKYTAYGTKYVSNYFNHFSPNLLGIYGTDTQYSILPSRGLLYLFDYPLLVLSLIVVFLAPSPARLVLIGWLFFSALPDSLTSDGQYGRFFVSYPVWPILIALGVTGALSTTKYKKFVLSLLVFLFLLAAGNFSIEYWTFFPYRYSRFSHFGYEELIEKIRSNINTYDRIYISSRVNDAKQYIYYVFYTRYDPSLFQSGEGITKIVEPNGWVRVRRINSIEFIQSIPTTAEFVNAHALLIGAPTEFHSKITPDFVIKDKKGDIIFQGVDSFKLYANQAQ